MSLLRVGRVGDGHAGRLRVRVSRVDAHTARIAPLAMALGPITAADVRRGTEAALSAGYRSAVTPALAERDQGPFLDAGFRVVERLHLLVHPLDDIPPSKPAAELRRARRRDQSAALRIDNAAFEPFWRLDAAGLADALTATSAVLFRLALRDAEPVGYAITGRSDHRGYVQRLAVDPAAEGTGIGRSLLLDSLRWLRRWGAREALVNTQEGNERSLRLYLRTGFVVQPRGLAVLRYDVDIGAERSESPPDLDLGAGG